MKTLLLVKNILLVILLLLISIGCSGDRYKYHTGVIEEIVIIGTPYSGAATIAIKFNDGFTIIGTNDYPGDAGILFWKVGETRTIAWSKWSISGANYFIVPITPKE